jgi:NAD(P)H-hydrate repair Nnr-like enzyme with NAD(P)H-hydrate epimerase domain
LIGAYRAQAIRAGEQAAMAALPPGTLIGRAAAAIERRAAVMMGGGYGRQVVLLVGSGDNGGDALYAGALLARRGAAVTAVALSDRHHQVGFDGFVAAGGRQRQLAELPDLLSGADLVIDGIVGIGGSGALRDGAAQAAGVFQKRGDVVEENAGFGKIGDFANEFFQVIQVGARSRDHFLR